MGRPKAELKKIMNEDSLNVCFSKRRAGLFKKASELCVLCGAEVAIIVFSPAGNPYSFGHPAVHSVLERCLQPPMADPAGDYDLTSSDFIHRGILVHELNRRHAELLLRLEEESKRKERLEKMARELKGEMWQEGHGQLSLEELNQQKTALDVLRERVRKRLEELSAPTAPPAPAVGFAVGASPTFETDIDIGTSFDLPLLPPDMDFTAPTSPWMF